MADRIDSEALANELRTTLARMLRRLRAASSFPLPQASVLQQLRRQPNLSIGDLATSEGVRPQSMAQTVSGLETLGLVQRALDPNDGRRSQLTLTPAGVAALAHERTDRNSWLSNALDEMCTAREREALAVALPALRRIADS